MAPDYDASEMPALPRPAPDVVHQELQGEVVLVNLKTNRIFVLNRTGARFWQLLEARGSRDTICAALVREFNVEREEIESEINSLLEALTMEGLVV